MAEPMHKAEGARQTSDMVAVDGEPVYEEPLY